MRGVREGGQSKLFLTIVGAGLIWGDRRVQENWLKTSYLVCTTWLSYRFAASKTQEATLARKTNVGRAVIVLPLALRVDIKAVKVSARVAVGTASRLD